MSNFEIPDNIGSPIRAADNTSINGPSTFEIPANIGKPLAQSNNIGDRIAANKYNTVTAAYQGAKTGLGSLASTIAKGVAKYTNPDLIPYIQKDYENDEADYAQAKAEHPISARVGNFVGSVAPYVAAGTLAGGLAATTVEAGGIGLLTNKPGQGNDVLNPGYGLLNAATAGVLGAVGKSIGNGVEAYQGLKNAVNDTSKGLSYNGPILARDAGSDLAQKASDSMVGRLMYGFREPARAAQVPEFQKTLTNYISNLASNSDTTQQIANAVKGTADSMKQEYSNMWTNLYANAEKAGIKDVQLPTAKPQVLQALQDAPNSITPKELKSIQDGLKGNSFEDVHGLKQDLWNIRSRLMNKASPTTEEQGLAENLKEAYWAVNTDIKSSLAKNPDLVDQFEHANSYTQGYKATFDPSNEKKLVGAITDIQDKQRGLQAFTNWMLNSKTPIRDISQQIGILGEQGSNAVQAQGLRQLLNKSTSPTGDFNLTSYLQGIQQIKNSPGQSLLYQPSLDALKGLHNMMQKNLADMPGGSGLLEGGELGGAGLLAIHHPVGAAATAVSSILGTKVMQKIIASSPLKNSLIGLGKMVDDISPNQGIADYLKNNAVKGLQRAGLGIVINAEGNPTLQ
jgi:hypothetical protein